MTVEGALRELTRESGRIASTQDTRPSKRFSLSRIRNDVLYADSIFLLLSTGLLSVLGALFWGLSAYLYTPAQVGVATALLAVLNVVTSLGLLGFEITLVRYLANRSDQLALVSTTFVIGSVTTVLASVGAIFIVPDFSSQLRVFHQPLFDSFFILFCPVSVASYLIESSFIALGRTRHIVSKTMVFSILKIGLIFVLVPLGAPAIYVAWMVALAAAVILSGGILRGRVRPGGSAVPTLASLQGLWSFSLNNYIAAFAEGLPIMLLPLIVITLYGKVASARYYMAMTVCGVVFLVSVAGAQSLFAAGSRKSAEFNVYLRKAILFIVCLTLPSAGLVFFFGTDALRILGNTYADGTGDMVRCFALSAVPMGIGTLAAAALKVRNANLEMVVASIVGAAAVLVLSFVFRPLGLTGIGDAWLIGQTVAALAMLAGLCRLALLTSGRHASVRTPRWRRAHE